MASLIETIAKRTGKTLSSETDAAEALTAHFAELDAKGKGAPVTQTPAQIAASINASVDEDALEDQAESIEAKLSTLVDTGKITPAVKDALHASLVGKPGERKALHLSTKANKAMGGTAVLAKDIVAALEKNNPVELKEKTGPQRLSLSNTKAGADESTKRVGELIEQTNKGGAGPLAFAI